MNLGELASSPMSSSSATAGISSAGSLLQSEREAVIGDVFVESVEVVHNDGRLLFDEISRQSQAYQVKQQQKGSSPNHIHTQGLSGSIILGTYHKP